VKTDLLTFKTRLESSGHVTPSGSPFAENVDLKVSIVKMHLQKQLQEYDVVIVALSQLTEVANYSNVHWFPKSPDHAQPIVVRA